MSHGFDPRMRAPCRGPDGRCLRSPPPPWLVALAVLLGPPLQVLGPRRGRRGAPSDAQVWLCHAALCSGPQPPHEEPGGTEEVDITNIEIGFEVLRRVCPLVLV